MFVNLVRTLALHALPHAFRRLPCWAEDEVDFRQKLSLLVNDIDEPSYRTACDKIADRSRVLDFSAGRAVGNRGMLCGHSMEAAVGSWAFGRARPEIAGSGFALLRGELLA
jgi:hypothetical protein